MHLYLYVLTHQHGGSEVELVKELCDKDVVFDQSLGISFLDILDDVGEPLPLLLAAGHPDKEHLEREQSHQILACLYQQNHTFLHSIRAPMLKRCTSSLRMDANGVTPMPPPTSTETS